MILHKQVCPSKEVFLKISQRFTGKHLCWVLFLIKTGNFIKKILFSESLFYRTPLMTASVRAK